MTRWERRRRSGRILGLAVTCCGAMLLLAGCEKHSPSVMATGGVGAHRIADYMWVLIGIASFVLLSVLGLIFYILVTRRGPDVQIKNKEGHRFVLIAGGLLPAIVLVALYGANVGISKGLTSPSTPARLTIDVIAHTWWWEARYAGTSAVTANEIHIPVGQPVRVRLRTADVIHSFWVPQLMPKTDVVTGKINETWLDATKPGRYRGQCAEYCGIEHAGMQFAVIAQPLKQFRAWLTNEDSPARPPTSTEAKAGEQVFLSSACSACHTVRGTSAQGRYAPDLTHVGSRQRLAAEVIPNTPGYLGGWIRNSQSLKPGNLMPPQPLSPDDLRHVIAYLDGLK